MNVPRHEDPYALDSGPPRTDTRRHRPEEATIGVLIALLPYLCAVTFSGMGSLCVTSCGGRLIPETDSSGQSDTGTGGASSDGQTEGSGSSGVASSGTNSSATQTSTGLADGSSEGEGRVFYVSGEVIGALVPISPMTLWYGTRESGFQSASLANVDNGAFMFSEALRDGDQWRISPNWQTEQLCTEPFGVIESASVVDALIECERVPPCVAAGNDCFEGIPGVDDCPPGHAPVELSCAVDESRPPPQQLCCQFHGD